MLVVYFSISFVMLSLQVFEALVSPRNIFHKLESYGDLHIILLILFLDDWAMAQYGPMKIHHHQWPHYGGMSPLPAVQVPVVPSSKQQHDVAFVVAYSPCPWSLERSQMLLTQEGPTAHRSMSDESFLPAYARTRRIMRDLPCLHDLCDVCYYLHFALTNVQ